MSWPMKKKKTIFSLLFFSLLLGKDFGSGGGMSLLCLMLLHHSIFLPCKNTEGRAPTSAAVRQVLLGSQVEQNMRAGSCCLGPLPLPSGDRAFLCVFCFKERNELFEGHKSVLTI